MSLSDISNNISTKWKRIADYIAITNDTTLSNILNVWKENKPLEFLKDS